MPEIISRTSNPSEVPAGLITQLNRYLTNSQWSYRFKDKEYDFIKVKYAEQLTDGTTLRTDKWLVAFSTRKNDHLAITCWIKGQMGKDELSYVLISEEWGLLTLNYKPPRPFNKVIDEEG